jgi:glycosyltransferase involved in cell wall biosynthesis
MELPYLKAPYFLDQSAIRLGGEAQRTRTEAERAIFARIFDGGPSLDELASDLARESHEPVELVRERLRARFADERSAIGLISVEIAPSYDIVVVEQGYGGVYVHTVEMLKRLGRRWSCLLICPEDPLFMDGSGTDVVTLRRLRETVPDLSYFSFVHIVRSIVRRTSSKLLLLTHRSQSLFLFDLVGSRRTVIYCDGFYDSGFAHARDFELVDSPERRREALKEVYYILANGDPNFFGLQPSPLVNIQLLVAGCFSLRDAEENWCWGQEQTVGFASAFPELKDRIKFMPPFTDPDLFHPESVDRERQVLFTTTMHNIDKKGFPELLKAMKQLRDMHVRCVVRRPELLPAIPAQCRERMEIGGLAKSEMIELYHKVWLNCRVSREESSPVSILETMICEVPQVTSTTVARQIPIIEDGKTGFVLDPDDTQGIVHALRTLLGDSKLRDEMGRECRRRALEYSFENRAALFEALVK